MLALSVSQQSRVFCEDKVSIKDAEFFESKIRPVLVKHCFECHSVKSKELGGGLRLDTREGMRSGGESGPVLVPGDPEKSLLVQALKYEGTEMPPEKPLSDSVVNDFVTWVKRNAPDPRKEASAAKPKVTPVESDLWSLQPVRNPQPPLVKNSAWPLNKIDTFVLARLEEADIKPGKDATPRVLIRRLYFDLVGLPPTLSQIELFEAECQKNRHQAIEKLVDDLLDSPRFGERWGRHWLDVARYGESNGNDGLGRNPSFPHAWRYRDYVIESFNRDKPYDQFVKEQIAGDLLTAETDAQRDEYLIATGFLALASKPAKAMNNNFDMDVVADQINVVGRGVLGMSIACARCHDHKFDPIPMRDYYALAGIFTSTETMWGLAGNEKLTAPATDLHVLKTPPSVLPPKDFVETVVLLESNTGKPKPIPKPKWKIGTPLAMGVRDRKKPADCKINLNGDAKKLGQPVARGFLSVCSFDDHSSLTINSETSGRLQLAEWMTDPRNPLTSRVIANRVWQHLFGEGIVRTPDDFGVYGEKPTHPLLLDYLASQFIEKNWSTKSLIRDIVLSRTYMLSSNFPTGAPMQDQENRLLARHTRRRLDAESLRDSMLAASGEIDLSPPEGSLIRHRDILVNLAGNLHQPSKHRSIFLCYLRNSPPPSLAAFNLPEFTTVTGKRDQTTVPGQALYLFNNSFVIDQAVALTQKVTAETQDSKSRIELIYKKILCRRPTNDELENATQMMESTRSEIADEQRSWSSLCQALLITNEFRYVD